MCAFYYTKFPWRSMAVTVSSNNTCLGIAIRSDRRIILVMSAWVIRLCSYTEKRRQSKLNVPFECKFQGWFSCFWIVIYGNFFMYYCLTAIDPVPHNFSLVLSNCDFFFFCILRQTKMKSRSVYFRHIYIYYLQLKSRAIHTVNNSNIMKHIML
jgi:hypothetical protein